MTSRDFCYFLQGFFELTAESGRPAAPITADQAELIRRHLALVFVHEIDPLMGPPEKQAKLNEIHSQGGYPHITGLDLPGGPVMRC